MSLLQQIQFHLHWFSVNEVCFGLSRRKRGRSDSTFLKGFIFNFAWRSNLHSPPPLWFFSSIRWMEKWSSNELDPIVDTRNFFCCSSIIEHEPRFGEGCFSFFSCPIVFSPPSRSIDDSPPERERAKAATLFGQRTFYSFVVHRWKEKKNKQRKAANKTKMMSSQLSMIVFVGKGRNFIILFAAKKLRRMCISFVLFTPRANWNTSSNKEGSHLFSLSQIFLKKFPVQWRHRIVSEDEPQRNIPISHSTNTSSSCKWTFVNVTQPFHWCDHRTI